MVGATSAKKYRSSARGKSEATSDESFYHANFVSAVGTVTNFSPNVPDAVFENVRKLYQQEVKLPLGDYDRAFMILSDKYAAYSQNNPIPPNQGKHFEPAAFRVRAFIKSHPDHLVVSQEIVRRILNYFSVRTNITYWSLRVKAGQPPY